MRFSTIKRHLALTSGQQLLQLNNFFKIKVDIVLKRPFCTNALKEGRTRSDNKVIIRKLLVTDPGVSEFLGNHDPTPPRGFRILGE